MFYALILLGLLPALFLSDIFSPAEDDEGQDAEGAGDTGQGDFLENLETSAPQDVLLPVTGDDAPVFNAPVDPDDVLSPDETDASPVHSPPVSGPILHPNDTPQAEYPVDGEGSLLQQLLEEQGDATAGIGFLGTQVTQTVDIALGDGDDLLGLGGEQDHGGGGGTLGDWDGTPLIRTAGDLSVVDAGAGDDTITTGTGAAYVFGGEGADRIEVGEGIAAVFGGAGDDLITGGDTAPAYLDGGAGDDVIIGGDAGEIIEGGVHIGGTGETDDDTISGGAGDDVIRGGYGADTLSGDAGDDVIDHLGTSDERVVAERHAFSWHIDDEADTLDGGAGDDTLIMDRADTATGGSGDDVFWLYFDQDSGVGAAEITDFEPGSDFLRVSLNPEVVHGTPDVEVMPSQDGDDGLVIINGDVVAILQGAADATAADVFVEVRDDVFR